MYSDASLFYTGSALAKYNVRRSSHYLSRTSSFMPSTQTVSRRGGIPKVSFDKRLQSYCTPLHSKKKKKWIAAGHQITTQTQTRPRGTPQTLGLRDPPYSPHHAANKQNVNTLRFPYTDNPPSDTSARHCAASDSPPRVVASSRPTPHSER